MNARRVRRAGVLFVLAGAAGAAALAASTPALDVGVFADLAARPIGPAVMGGRISAIAGVTGEKTTLYVGTAAGGVFRSEDDGVSFTPIFDKVESLSVGAIAVDPKDPKTLWVGTGETWVRNSVSVGTGLYKTTDGGEHWNRVGLDASERIASIAIDPKDTKRVLVCVPGHLWDDHPDRGVYRTTDGGTTWAKTLFTDNATGCSDLALDPQNPSTAYAGMWPFRRKPWTFNSGGTTGGLYKTTDGGTTWRKLDKGLPEGATGRIAVAIAPSRAARVYALVEAKTTAIYRSDDAGATWEQGNSGAAVGARPFYFATLIVDPKDHERVYKPGFMLAVSSDGAKTFGGAMGFGGGGTHPDHHALWVDPADPRHLVLGTDGGIYVTHDQGQHWRMVGTLPVSQFYHVAVDDQRPYRVFGGLQDNGSWMSPSAAPGGLSARHWRNIGMGDGFWALPDPTNPDTVFVEYQGGKVSRLSLATGEGKDIQPYARPGEKELRFNWNTPLVMSPTRPGTIYIGSQYLMRSRDRGESWDRLSPDLTTDDPAKQKQGDSGGLTVDNSDAENYCTIVSIAESPRDGSTLWAGTDDGRLQVTRDGGSHWTDVAKNVTGLPKGTWVSSIEASHHAAGTAFVTFDGHATGDMATYVYRTDDFGASWRSVAGPGLRGFAHIVRQDPRTPTQLWAGTEFGLFVSLDAGAAWTAFTAGIPAVPVRDLAFQERDGDLVIATHGRGLYIIDDLTPLRALTPEALGKDALLLPSRPGVLTLPAGEQRMDGDADFTATEPEEAASIVYYLKSRHIFGDLKVEVRDASGKLISTLPGGRKRGINRVPWPMRLAPPKVPPASSLVQQPYAFLGPRAAEGTYQVRLIRGEQALDGTVRIASDPRSPHSAADRALQQKTALRLYRMIEQMTGAVERLIALRDKATKDGRKAQADAAEALRAEVVAVKEGMLAREVKLRERLVELYGSVNGYDGRPTASQLERADLLSRQLDTFIGKVATLEKQP